MKFHKAKKLNKLLRKADDALLETANYLDSLCWEYDHPEFLLEMKDAVDGASTLLWNIGVQLDNCLVVPTESCRGDPVPDGNKEES